MQPASPLTRSLPIGGLFATWLAAVWLPAWIGIMACLGISSDARHFTLGQAWTVTAVTFVSPLTLFAIAASFVRRVPDGHGAKRLTGIVCMLCVVPYPIAFFQVFVLWFWNV